MVCFVRIVHICFIDEAVFTSSLPTLLHLTAQTFGDGGVLAIPLGCLSQLSLGLKFNQFHQIFNHHITLGFLALVFSERTLTLNMDESVCSFSYLGRGMESHDLFSSWMIGKKLCKFSRGLCFEKHHDCLLLKPIEWFVLYDPLRAVTPVGNSGSDPLGDSCSPQLILTPSKLFFSQSQ